MRVYIDHSCGEGLVDSLLQLLWGLLCFGALVLSVSLVLGTQWLRTVKFVPFRAYWTKRVVEEDYFMRVGLPLMVLCGTTIVMDNGESATVKMSDSPLHPLEVTSSSARSRG